jgi:protein SCO1/2
MFESDWSAETPKAEEDFAARVSEWSGHAHRHAELTTLLREEHPCYAQRGRDAVVRMRGWVFVGLARQGITAADLPFVLEELESGKDAYLVAAAARALRSFDAPVAGFVTFVLTALAHLRSTDEPISFASYGGYESKDHSTVLGEILLTLEWLAPVCGEFLPAIEEMHATWIPQRYRRDVKRIIKAIPAIDQAEAPACCRLFERWGNVLSWKRDNRRDGTPLESVAFQDHAGRECSFAELFRGRVTIVAFFYTRCDNPMKCALTITKLARIQKMLAELGSAEDVQIVAITYDPLFDSAERMARFGAQRGLHLDDRTRLVRTTAGFDAMRRHFSLGINFVESIVNRHRLEVFLLDPEGRIAVEFARLQWQETDVVDRAMALQRETPALAPPGDPDRFSSRRGLMGLLGTLASVGVAFFPKCPVCWAAYASVLGVAGFGQIPYAPWLLPVLLVLMLFNLTSVGVRAYETGRMGPFAVAAVGSLTILASQTGVAGPPAALIGVLLTLVGSGWAALDPILRRTFERSENT